MTILKIRLVLGAAAAILLISCSSSRALEKSIEKQSMDHRFFSGVYVVDANTGKEILDIQGDKYFTPASNVKLFTLYAALKTLKDSVPSFEYLVSGDSLIIRGTADPMFLNDSLHQKSLHFLKNHDAKIYLLDKEIEDEIYGAGWSWDDYTYDYMVEKSLMPVYGNRVSVKKERGDVQVLPNFFEDRINVKGNRRFVRDRDKNYFYVDTSKDEIDLRIPFKTSNQLVADLLSEEIGIKVTLLSDDVKRKFISFKDLPYDSLYTKMIKDSDNFIAEQIMLQVAYQTVGSYKVSKGISYILKSHLSEIPQNPRWVDGSGLSRYNLFSPESVVYVLKKLYQEVPTEKLNAYFPVGGEEGSLKHFFKGQNYIRAKSGTLSNNYSLSGYLTTKKGKTLIFSYMNNHYQGSSNDRKKEMAIFFKELHDNY